MLSHVNMLRKRICERQLELFFEQQTIILDLPSLFSQNMCRKLIPTSPN